MISNIPNGMAKQMSDAAAEQIESGLEALAAADLLKEQPFKGISTAQLMVMADVDKRKRILDLVGNLLHAAQIEMIEARTDRGMLLTMAYLAPDLDDPKSRTGLVTHLRTSLQLTLKALRLAETHLNRPPMLRKFSHVTGDFEGIKAWDEPVEQERFDTDCPADLGTNTP